MPLYAYCPYSNCAAKIPYETVKPSKCPRCNRAFADAFKVVTETKPTVSRVTTATVEEESDAPRLTRSELLKVRASRSSGTKVKPRLKRYVEEEEVSHVMNPPAPQEENNPVFDDDHSYDEREARELARELAASIDPSTIIIQDQDDKVVRFGQLVEEAKRSASK